MAAERYLSRRIPDLRVGNNIDEIDKKLIPASIHPWYIRRYTSPNENFEYGYPHSNALLQFELKLERCKPHKPARHPKKCDVINDVKLFPTVYGRIYCRKFLTLSNQTSRYKLNCIRITCKRRRHRPTIGGNYSVQWRKVGRS